MTMNLIKKQYKKGRPHEYKKERLIPCQDCGKYIMTKAPKHFRCRNCARKSANERTRLYQKGRLKDPAYRKKLSKRACERAKEKDFVFNNLLTEKERLENMNKLSMKLLNNANLKCRDKTKLQVYKENFKLHQD